MRPSFDWSDLQVFIAIFRARTLSSAARQLGVNVSTASRRLAALERALGARLFDRTPDGLAPTSVAEALWPAAERVEQGIGESVRAVESLERNPVGTVRVTAMPSVAETFVVPMLIGLRQRYPSLRVQLDVSASVADLTRNEADLAIRGARPHAGDLVAKRLFEAPWVLAAAAPLAKRLGVLRTLRDVPLVGWPPEYASSRPAEWLRRVAPENEPVLVTSSLESQLAAARLGLGVTLVVEPYLRHSPGLVPVALAPALLRQAPWAREALWLVSHRALRHVPRVAVTWAFVLEAFASLAGTD